MVIGFIGDLHGRAIHALSVLLIWQSIREKPFDLVVQVGALGVKYCQCDETSGPYQFGSPDLMAVEFPHTLADILNAVFSSGLIVERKLERTGEAVRVSGRGTLPTDFFVSARKPE